MIDVYMEHNPYKPLTKVTLDWEPVAANSALNYKDRPFQEWVEGLPRDLYNETGDDEFYITFHGTVLDYEDLQSVARDAEKDDIHITCEHVPAKEVTDKVEAIEDIFREIMDNPYFPDLKTDEMQNAFKIAMGTEFPVNVVATMSSGKSTLVNALLGQKLMPSQQEACTATITELRDNDKSDHFVAAVYDKNGQPMKFVDPLTLAEMEKLNKDPEVSKIEAEGDIPFVSSDETALVLVDTPGPNNARNEEHQIATLKALSSSSKTLVLYVLNSQQLGINDDSAFLSQVADSMKVGGKQSRDRFIFVLNKVDTYKKGEDSVDSALQNARDYLDAKGIQDPNIYPASALTALELRSDFRNVEVKQSNLMDIYGDPQRINDPDFMGTMMRIISLNNNPDLHLENYAPLAPSAKNELQKELEIAQAEGDLKEQALIHSGVKSIEAAIGVYVEKYAKTAKIRGIVNTFSQKLESQRCFEKAKKEISENQEKKEEIQRTIQAIEAKLNDGKQAKAFEDRIKGLDFSQDVNRKTMEMIRAANAKIDKQLEEMEGQKLTSSVAESIYSSFVAFAKDLQARTRVNIEDAINQAVEEQCNALTKEYVERLRSFSEDIPMDAIAVNPVPILAGEVDSVRTAALIAASTETERVKVGQEWVANTSKKWYKPWTWFQEKGHYRDIYEDRQFVNGEKLAQKFFAPIQKDLYAYQKQIAEVTKKQTKQIQQELMQRFKMLDKVLADKMKELKQCTASQADAEKELRKANERLTWLEGIQGRVNAILDI